MTNQQALPFERPVRTASIHPSVALAAIGAATLGLIRKLDNWLFASPLDTPSNAAELVALADRLEESQPSYAADLRAAALRAQGLDTQ
ncbi:conserved hypothetical protein [Rubrivivax sp. A210]|uniref:hypothetical protein n=1 Tax=Rubrivivax sp. A210 TaxID=2772301 RepID=UPI00191AC8B8|nr:hypothetical protein [Rubrivivax sp. A210]CAD5366258.1 conserved hypothetical protein [Rubrivivax sp. A210]